MNVVNMPPLFTLKNVTTGEVFNLPAQNAQGYTPVRRHTNVYAVGTTYHLDFDYGTLNPQDHYVLWFGGQGEEFAVDVVMRNILDRYHTTARQGLWQTPGGFNSAVWAPTAVEVYLVVYPILNQSFDAGGHFVRGDRGGSVRQDFLRNPDNYTKFSMTRDDDTGMWHLDNMLPLNRASKLAWNLLGFCVRWRNRTGHKYIHGHRPSYRTWRYNGSFVAGI